MIVALFADKHTRHAATMVTLTLLDIACFAALTALIVSVLP